MTKFDWVRVQREKDAYRDKMAALPVEGKLRMLERIRERTLVLRGGHKPSHNVTRASQRQTTVAGLPASAARAVGFGRFGAASTLVAAMTHVTATPKLPKTSR